MITIARFLTAILALTSWIPCFAQGPTEFEYGPRPPLSVFDPTGFLEPETVKEISDPLAGFYKKEGIDVMVVVLMDLKQAPPEHVARQFAGAWCDSPIHCVVLHVPGREDSPWIVPGGKTIDQLNPQQIEQMVADARRRAASEPKEPDKVKTAASEAADMLRFWMAKAITHDQMIQSESRRMRLELETQSRRWKITAMIAAASIILLAAGLSFLVVVLRNRAPRYFPNLASQFRLGAPHSGGNHALADLGAPIP